MPIGSRKLSAFKNKFNAGRGSDSLNVNLSIAYSGNTSANLSYTGTSNVFTDATTVTYSISTNRSNATFAYNMESLVGNVVASDFADSLATGTVTTDSNGNATVTKTITSTTGSGHKAFRLNLARPSNSNDIFVRSANSNLYEVVPANITGGNTTIVDVQRSVPGFSPVRDVVGLVKRHMFTANGNTTVNVVSTGNYNGNANIWNNQFFVNRGTNHSSDIHFAYWDEGLAYRALIIGAGGVGLEIYPAISGGGGAGELGVLEYPLNNVSAGSYVFTVGKASATSNVDSSGNTTIFNGNVSLHKTAWRGGHGANFSGAPGVDTAVPGEDGGSGGGAMNPGLSRSGRYSGFGGYAVISDGKSELANKVTTTSFGNNSFKQYVKFANGNNGSWPVDKANANTTSDAQLGGGIGGAGGPAGKGGYDSNYTHLGGLPRPWDSWNDYGWPQNAVNSTGFPPPYPDRQLRSGIEFEYMASNVTANLIFRENQTNAAFRTVPDAERNVFGQRWYQSPVYGGATFDGNSKQLMATGGQGGSGTDFVTSSRNIASTTPGFGSGDGNLGKDGLISITYPYRPAYRFITPEDLS